MASIEKTKEMLAYEEQEKSKSLCASLAVVLMVGLVGLPVWWFTTDVYRAHIPYDDIESLSSDTTVSDIDSMVAVTSVTDFEIVFTLLNPDPTHWNASWNIEDAINTNMQPMLNRLSDVADFRISSQVMFYMNIPQSPIYNSTTSHYYYTYQSLPHLINPIESKLGSSVYSSYTLNFILYLPLKSHYPLYIKDAKGETIESNSFLSPRWGGLMFYNPTSVPKQGHQNDLDPVSQQVLIDMRDVIPVFSRQLKELLGVPCDVDCDSTLNQKDVDHFLRSRILDNIATAGATLQSLAKLLKEQKNMVISDSISDRVHTGLQALVDCKHALDTGNLTQAARVSKVAIENAEKAFFDPTILERLYFPEDQKFAIYVPMFLPLSIPVAMSLKDVIHWMKRIIRHRL